MLKIPETLKTCPDKAFLGKWELVYVWEPRAVPIDHIYKVIISNEKDVNAIDRNEVELSKLPI